MTPERSKGRAAFIVGLIAITLVTTQPLDAAAIRPSRTPDVFRGVYLELSAGDVYEADCPVRGGQGTDIEIFLLDEPTRGSSREVNWASGTTDEFLSLRFGSLHEELVVVESNATSGPYQSGVAPTVVREDGAILRAAWAGWSAEVECVLLVNGEAVESVMIPPERATFLWPTDFDGGAAADSPRFSVGAGMRHERTSSGFLFALLDVPFGDARIVDPLGQRRSGAFQIVAEPTDGAWVYEVGRTMSSSRGDPILWILELPR